MNNLPKTFDLLTVEYRNGAGTCLAYAPCGKVHEEDTVKTTFGVGKVIEKSYYHTPDEKVIRCIDKVLTIDRVLYKLQPVEYEDEENGVPEE